MKYMPKVGDALYIHQRTGNYWIDSVHRPYTVVEVKNENNIVIREERAIFPKERYYNTMPISIEENPAGKLRNFKWSEKKQRWLESPQGDYPYCAVFGVWEWTPYLN